MTESAAKPPVYLVDASGFIYRAYFSRPALSATDGAPANAVVGFVEMMAHFMRYSKGAHIGVVFDTRRPSWRNQRYPQYKANRQAPPTYLSAQFIPIQQACDALNLTRIEFEGFEADDMIATYADEANRRGHHVVVASSDKDLMQLVSDTAVIQQWDPMTKAMYGEEAVRAKWGVHPTKMADMFGLAGDTADNIKGVSGIGKQIAAELIQRYGDLENVIEHWAEIPGKTRGRAVWTQREEALLAKELFTLTRDAPLPVPFESLRPPSPDQAALRRFLNWLGPNYVPEAMKEYA